MQDEAIKTDYFSETAEAFEQQYQTDPAFRERVEIWTALLAKYRGEAKTAIDLGCGSGVFSYHLWEQGLQVTGVDGAPGMISLCERRRSGRNNEGLRFLLGRLPDLEGVPLEAADLVISSSVLEYVQDLPRALKRMEGLLRPRGTMLLSLPNARSVYRRIEPWRYRLTGQPEYYAHVVNVITVEALAELVRPLGLAVVEHVYFAHADPVSRILRRLRVPAQFRGNLFVVVLQRV